MSHHVGVPRGERLASGSLYGSAWFVWLTMVPGGVVAATAAAMAGWVSGAAVVGVAVGLTVLVSVVKRLVTVDVTRSGVALTGRGYGVSVRWDEVEGLDRGRLGAKLLLRDPVRLGLRTTKRLAIAMLDPRWEDRPVGRAVIRHLNTREPL